MSGRYKILTDMTLTLVGVVNADQHDITLEVTFNVEPERSATYLEPGGGATVEVQTIRLIENHGGPRQNYYEAPAWLWPMVEGDESLAHEMLAEAWESDESARDHQADSRREEAMIDKFNQSQGAERG